jgi:hypothetical protein
MTQRSTAARYGQLAAGQEEVESCLLESVAEHLNGARRGRAAVAADCQACLIRVTGARASLWIQRDAG